MLFSYIGLVKFFIICVVLMQIQNLHLNQSLFLHIKQFSNVLRHAGQIFVPDVNKPVEIKDAAEYCN